MSEPLEELTVSNTVHYWVMAKLRERNSVSKQTRQKSNLERFELRKFNDIEVKEKNQVEISNRFAALDT
jgi:hypothetical protein